MHGDPTHNRVAELLSAYIDDQVTPKERDLVEQHLAKCAECRYDLDTLRQTVHLVQSLPHVPAPRPFTLRQADIAPVQTFSHTGRRGWRLAGLPGLAAGLVALVCVVLMGGGLLVAHRGSRLLPSSGTIVAFEQPVADEAAAPQPVQKNLSLEEEPAIAPTVVPSWSAQEADTEGVAEPPSSPKPTASLALEIAAAASPSKTGEAVSERTETGKAEEEMLSEQAEESVQEAKEAPLPAPAPAEAEDSSLEATPYPAGSGEEQRMGGLNGEEQPAAASSPTPSLAAAPLATQPLLLEVQDLRIEVTPGLILVEGRLPLPESQALMSGLWRDEKEIRWARQQSRRTLVEKDGRFVLRLEALPGIPDYDLFSIQPADYEVRLWPVDPPSPEEARIPFSTYPPAP